MTKYLLLLLLWGLMARPACAQQRINAVVDAEYKAGHFNGTVLVVKDGKVVTQRSRGYANLQFAVPIAKDTRLPIASMTKLFTAVLVLQLYEKGVLNLDDAAAWYVPELPAACQRITIRELLTHCSGLKNEPLSAYHRPYSPTEFVKNFVVKKEDAGAAAFNYNNVDYVVLTRVLEGVAHKPYPVLLRDNILQPLHLRDTGVVAEDSIVPRLAYGYHNYTFGAGKQAVPLKNDGPRFLSNYAGAGAIYATAADLLLFVQALGANELLSAATTATLLTAPQHPGFVEYARGEPTIGFYWNTKTFPQPTLERRGSIDGFNSALLTDKNFRKIVILLTNTDAADLETMGDKIYAELL